MPSSTSVELSDNGIDILSNGWKIRNNNAAGTAPLATLMSTPPLLKTRSKLMVGLLVKLTPSF